LDNIGRILKACGCDFSNVVKVNVFLRDMKDFEGMNEAYLDVFGNNPPAR
jgi:2-iminobutanoate/2-iminopropanoate deaminase